MFNLTLRTKWGQGHWSWSLATTIKSLATIYFWTGKVMSNIRMTFLVVFLLCMLSNHQNSLATTFYIYFENYSKLVTYRKKLWIAKIVSMTNCINYGQGQMSWSLATTIKSLATIYYWTQEATSNIAMTLKLYLRYFSPLATSFTP